MEWNEAVVVKFPDRYSQPRMSGHDRDGVRFQLAEFTDTHAGSRKEFHTKPTTDVRFLIEGAHELDVVTIVQEFWE